MSELFLRSVRFRDFRTFGTFDAELVPAPGLTLLVGTNGLGKSSFFDALEWGLTGEVRRFKSYMGAADPGKYLTRRNAQAGSHRVSLGFSNDLVLSRGQGEKPTSDEVIAILKKATWTAQIHDIGTYLAFTHFLGQAAQQRFTSRERNEQWESLKGPSGIDRLDEVRNGLRGRSTELAFNRRIRRETAEVAEAMRQLTEWQGWRTRLLRLREAAAVAGAMSPDTFNNRLAELIAGVSAIVPNFREDTAAKPGDRLVSLRLALEARRRDVAPRRALIEALADLPERYVALAAAAASNTPALDEATVAVSRELRALQQAEAATRAARERLEGAAAEVAALESELARLEPVRIDLDLAERAAADLVRLNTERVRLNADLTQHRVELRALEGELSNIHQRAVVLAGLAAAAQGAAAVTALARQLSDLRSRAALSAAAQADAEVAAVVARNQLSGLATERNRLTSELERARTEIEAAQARASSVAAAVAAIASHMHDDDLDCPVCRTRFAPGALRIVAEEAASAQDAKLAAAEARRSDLNTQLDAAIQAIAVAEAVVRVAEVARETASADTAAVNELEARLAAGLPQLAGDLLTAANDAERRAVATLAEAQAAGVADETRRSALAVQQEQMRANLSRLESELGELDEQIADRAAAQRSATERLAAAGHGDADKEGLDRQLADVRARRSTAEAARISAEETVRLAIALEAAARSRRTAADETQRHLVAARDSAAGALTALQDRWRAAGLSGTPDVATLENALSSLADLLSNIEKFEDERAVLVSAHEAMVRDQDVRDVEADMVRVGGAGAADAPERYETELAARHKAAQDALAITETTHVAVGALADKLRDEATKFSTQFLTPLNGLIDDFNEALLSTPGETVRLNATYYKDRTQFDMGLHYRDPLDDALFDTELPPQVVLSEGQLAANGFSILCAASTAYPWSRWRSLLLDDPLQHNDIIHAAAFVDLMRNLVEFQGYQLIMSSHDRGEAEFIRRKFDAAGMPCSVIALTAPSKAGVRYLPPEHNGPARDVLAKELKQSAQG